MNEAISQDVKCPECLVLCRFCMPSFHAHAYPLFGDAPMVKYPYMRAELVNHLKVLSDKEYQTRAWVNSDYPEGIEYDAFDLCVNFFLDDTNLEKDSDSYIGIILISKEEARNVESICFKIRSMLNIYGTDLTDLEYISLPEWNGIVDSARKGLELVKNAAE